MQSSLDLWSFECMNIEIRVQNCVSNNNKIKSLTKYLQKLILFHFILRHTFTIYELQSQSIASLRIGNLGRICDIPLSRVRMNANQREIEINCFHLPKVNLRSLRHVFF